MRIPLMPWLIDSFRDSLAYLSNYFTFPFFLPRIPKQISNWPLYLINYTLRRGRPDEYMLRNGYRLIDAAGTLAGTLAVVFIRREYGIIKPCQTIVDIGANMGAFTIYAAMSCPGAKIYCFEPEPKNFSTLSWNIELNSLQHRVRAYPWAVAARREKRRMAIGESPLNTIVFSRCEKELKMVECITLQDILTERGLGVIDLLKVNCEGAEYEIFENCTETEFARVFEIRLEYHNLDSDRRNGKWLAAFFLRHGYRIARFSRYRDESGFIWAIRNEEKIHFENLSGKDGLRGWGPEAGDQQHSANAHDANARVKFR